MLAFTTHNVAIKVLIEDLRFTNSSIEKVQKKKKKKGKNIETLFLYRCSTKISSRDHDRMNFVKTSS
jgi:hypothetical protein